MGGIRKRNRIGQLIGGFARERAKGLKRMGAGSQDGCRKGIVQKYEHNRKTDIANGCGYGGGNHTIEESPRG